jgi:hypothetical protein
MVLMFPGVNEMLLVRLHRKCGLVDEFLLRRRCEAGKLRLAGRRLASILLIANLGSSTALLCAVMAQRKHAGQKTKQNFQGFQLLLISPASN